MTLCLKWENTTVTELIKFFEWTLSNQSIVATFAIVLCEKYILYLYFLGSFTISWSVLYKSLPLLPVFSNKNTQ